jgi:hypothetical protein
MDAINTKTQALIIKNVIAACGNIEKLNKKGYDFLYLCSGFIAHYDIEGFKEYYREHSLVADIEANYAQNQWRNFREGEEHAAYYHSKRDIYNAILGNLLAVEETKNSFNAQLGNPVEFLRSHFQIINIK